MSIDTSFLGPEDSLSPIEDAETNVEEVRDMASQCDIDVSKYLLGDVLSTIVGDDEIRFGFKYAPYNTDSAQSWKESSLIRLRWEIGLKETPEDIRKRLEKFLPVAEETDWQIEERFLKVKETWHKNIKEFVQRQIELNESYGDAMNYEYDMTNILHPEYKELLFGTQK